MSTPRLSKSLLSTEQPPVALEMSPNGQTVQVQLMLQMLQRRAVPLGAHPQAQRKQTPQDPHLPVLRQKLHARNVSQQTHAETRGANG